LGSHETEHSNWDELRLDFNFNLNRIDTKTRMRVISDLLSSKDPSGLVFVCGCGVGVESKAFRDQGKTVVGLDINRKSVKVASANVQNVSFVVGDIQKLPFKDSIFSKTVCSAVLEHVPDDRRAILELQRTLKIKGELVLTTPRRKHSKCVQHILEDVKEKFGHVREGYTVDDFEALIRNSRLQISRIIFYWGPLHELMLKLFELTPHTIKLSTSEGLKIKNEKSMSKSVRKKLWSLMIYLLTVISYLDDLTPTSSRSGLGIMMDKTG
jgi:SAM-dependent methyltransferase